MPAVGTTFSIYPPLTSDLPYLSVIITPGNRFHPLVTAFDTAAEAEAFNIEMSLELKAEEAAPAHHWLAVAGSRLTASAALGS